jgi:hypothetical protein
MPPTPFVWILATGERLQLAEAPNTAPNPRHSVVLNARTNPVGGGQPAAMGRRNKAAGDTRERSRSDLSELAGSQGGHAPRSQITARRWRRGGSARPSDQGVEWTVRKLTLLAPSPRNRRRSIFGPPVYSPEKQWVVRKAREESWLDDRGPSRRCRRRMVDNPALRLCPWRPSPGRWLVAKHRLPLGR